MDPLLALGLLQGAYFGLVGAWALVHVDSFMRVTGAKTDVWLVKTVSALVLVIGLALIAAALRGRVGPDLRFLALGSAMALALVDLVYVAKGTIARVYLLDALIEGLFVAAWALHSDGEGPLLLTAS